MGQFTGTIGALTQGLAFVEAMAPVVSSFGGTAGNVATIAGELATIGQTVLDTAATGQQVSDANDLATVRDLTAALQAKNDALAAAIAAS